MPKENARTQIQILSLERYVVVNAVDVHWQDHLTEMEKQEKGFVVMDKDPLSEYKNEAFVHLRTWGE